MDIIKIPHGGSGKNGPTSLKNGLIKCLIRHDLDADRIGTCQPRFLRGTLIHAYLERWLLEDKVSEVLFEDDICGPPDPSVASDAYRVFLGAIAQISVLLEGHTPIWPAETRLEDTEIGLAGTMDLVTRKNGLIYVWDWKSQSRMSVDPADDCTAFHTKTYRLQKVAYTYLVEKELGEQIHQYNFVGISTTKDVRVRKYSGDRANDVEQLQLKKFLTLVHDRLNNGERIPQFPDCFYCPYYMTECDAL